MMTFNLQLEGLYISLDNGNHFTYDSPLAHLTIEAINGALSDIDIILMEKFEYGGSYIGFIEKEHKHIKFDNCKPIVINDLVKEFELTYFNPTDAQEGEISFINPILHLQQEDNTKPIIMEYLDEKNNIISKIIIDENMMYNDNIYHLELPKIS